MTPPSSYQLQPQAADKKSSAKPYQKLKQLLLGGLIGILLLFCLLVLSFTSLDQRPIPPIISDLYPYHRDKGWIDMERVKKLCGQVLTQERFKSCLTRQGVIVELKYGGGYAYFIRDSIIGFRLISYKISWSPDEHIITKIRVVNDNYI